MKLVILTSDIIDGLIVSERIVRSGKDVKALIYEKRKKTLKSTGKRVVLKWKGITRHLGYNGITARNKGIQTLGVEDINSYTTKNILDKTEPDLMVVVGTRKLEPGIFGKARMGAINLHTGILPYYRGADSEFWALYNGEEDKIGVSIHFIDERLDAGDVILTALQTVAPEDDHRSLRMKNILLGADKMVEAIDLIGSGDYSRMEQDEDLAETYRSATSEDIKKYLGSKAK